MKKVSKGIIKKIFRKRDRWSHKGNFGKLLIIGGSKKYSGSPALAALAAYRVGVDLVTVASPERAANIIASFTPDLITYPLKGDYLNENHLRDIFLLVENSHALVMGGGLERSEETLKTILKILKGISIPCVIDADAIYAVAKEKKVLRKEFVVTPHSHEFFILTGRKPTNDVKKRAELVKNVAQELNCVVLLKGNVDVISDGDEVFINETGNPYMTVGGTGDTLAGILGALLARKVDPLSAACAAAYINGRAGDLAARKFGEGLMASDLLQEIPEVIRRI